MEVPPDPPVLKPGNPLAVHLPQPAGRRGPRRRAVPVRRPGRLRLRGQGPQDPGQKVKAPKGASRRPWSSGCRPTWSRPSGRAEPHPAGPRQGPGRSTTSATTGRCGPSPMVSAILGDLQLLQKMKLADLAALDGAISCIRVWKLGNIEARIMPTEVAINRLAEMLCNNVGGGVMDLVWGPEIELHRDQDRRPPVPGRDQVRAGADGHLRRPGHPADADRRGHPGRLHQQLHLAQDADRAAPVRPRHPGPVLGGGNPPRPAGDGLPLPGHRWSSTA
jgi:hypothetical protein